jgi:hypothetical protein
MQLFRKSTPESHQKSATAAALMSLPVATAVVVPQEVNSPIFKETKNGDLSNFLKDRKALLLGDTEGYLSTALREKLINHIQTKQDCIVFNGDISDYTNRSELSKDDFEKRDRFFFLEFVKMINDYPDNIVSTIGNRDLNKLTVFHLIQYEKLEKWWKSKDEKGKNIGYKELMDMAEKLAHKNLNEEIPWLVKDMTNFFPYWNSTSESIKSWVGWKSSGGKYLSLYERYLAIFGTDPSIGFMTAMNTLKGLMIEIGGEDGFNDIIELSELKTKTENKKEVADDFNIEYLPNKYAAFVFIVYARILDPELSIESNKRWKYDGCLYKYLTSNPLVGYAENTENKSLYLFSHGGIHSSFNGVKLISELIEIYETTFKTKIIEEKEEFISKLSQKGGNIQEVNDITNFNIKIKELITSFYKQFEGNPSDELKTYPVNDGFILTALSCPIGKNVTLSNQEKNNIHLKSPIMSGFTEIIKDDKNVFLNTEHTNNRDSGQYGFNAKEEGNNQYGFNAKEEGNSQYGFNVNKQSNNKNTDKTVSKQIYNILGHSPTGFGYNFVRGNNKQIVICTDFSNSFLKDDKEYGKDKFDHNNLVLYLQFNDNKFILDGNIFVQKKDTIILQGWLPKENLPNPIQIEFKEDTISNDRINKFDDKDIYEGSATIHTINGDAKGNVKGNIYMVKGDGHNKSLKLVANSLSFGGSRKIKSTIKNKLISKLRNNNVKSKSYRKKTQRKLKTKKINKRR